MTDRKYLELAAKAAGIKNWWDGWTDYGRETGTYWNPLTDDGDALRLAVKLNISLWLSPGNVVQTKFSEGGSVTVIAGQDLGAPDKAAATRRAIVRAAAEIGRSME